MQQYVDPFVRCEFLASFCEDIEVHFCDLNGLKCLNKPRRDARVFRKFILHIDDAPDATHEQFGVVLDRFAVDSHSLDRQIVEHGLISIVLFIQRDGYSVDDLISTLFSDRGLDQLRFIAVNVVFAQDFFDGFDACFNRRLVVSGAVLAQQVFQHVCGHYGIALDCLDEVFTHDKAGEVGVNLGI